MGKKRGSAYWGFIFTVLLLFATMVAGCGEDTSTSASPATPASDQSDAPDQGEAQILAIGEKGANNSAEISVQKITTTSSLNSSEASALLLTGEPGEEASQSTRTPASGNEFLMVTLKFKNINAKPPTVTPDSLKLKDSQGKEFKEVETGGYGGIYNMKQVDAGKEATVTAVYEVPTGETGLTLTYQPYGDGPVSVRIR